MTPLRRQMIEGMELRGYAPSTIEGYVHAVAQLAGHYHRSPERLSEPEVRRFLESNLPSGADLQAVDGFTLWEQGNLQGAAQVWAKTLQGDEQNAPALIGMGLVHLAQGNLEEARVQESKVRELDLERLPDRQTVEKRLSNLRAHIYLMEHLSGDETPPAEGSVEALFDGACRAALQGDYATALEGFFGIVQKDRKFREDAGRKGMLAVFDILPADAELTAEYRGKLNLTVEDLRRIIGEAHAAGWQLGIHAIGDAAIELTVDELAAALKNAPRPDHRHYLNHFTVMPSTETMLTMAENEISITQQPNFTYTLEGRYVEYLDGERLQHNNPLRTPMDLGIHVAISSDILPIGPMTGIQAAVTRKGMSGQVYGKEEALTVVEALRAYTALGAWLTFGERDTGTIEPGKFADFLILDKDFLAIPEAEIPALRPLMTVVGGKTVHLMAPFSTEIGQPAVGATAWKENFPPGW